MSMPVAIWVADYSSGPFAVSVEDGQRLCDGIAPIPRAGTPVALSFAGIEVLIGAFLATSIGPCCADYSEAELDRLLSVRYISASDRETVKRNLVNPRRYDANRTAYDTAWREELGDDYSRCAMVAEREN